MSISEISRTGQTIGFTTAGQNGAPAEAERQVVSPSGNASPLSGQSQAANDAPAAASPELTEKAVAIVEEFLQSHSRSLQFEVDDESGMEILTVLDGETGEIIRRFPADEVVASARYIAENTADVTTGVLLDQEG